MIDMLKIAGKIAVPQCDNDLRTFWLGAVAVRQDQVVVKSKNGSARPDMKENAGFTPAPDAHAEARVLNKAGKNATICVARISRLTGQYAMSRPCCYCMAKMKAYKVRTCYYTVDSKSYGVIQFSSSGEILDERVRQY
jgi:tRNA(Arg) A34 adenosine deaminase TadA